MKKTILMLVLCGAFVAGQAQMYERSEVKKENKGISVSPQKDNVTIPEKVKSAFNNAYYNAKVTWQKEGERFRAMFKSNDELETIVIYDKNGRVLLTEKELKQDASPSEIAKYCDDHKLGKPCKVWEVDSKNSVRKYFVTRNGQTVWFDKSGKPMNGKEAHATGHKPGYYK